MIWGNTPPPLGTKLNRSHPASSGLVACWPMNEGRGSIINDACGLAKGNTVYGLGSLVQWNPTNLGKFFNPFRTGGSTHFHCGTGDQFNLPKFSLSIWWQANDCTNWMGPFQNRMTGKNGFQFINATNSNVNCIPHLVVWDGSAEAYNIKSSVTFPLPFTKMSHFVWTYNGTTVKLYVNGINIPTANGLSGWAASVEGVIIGRGWSNINAKGEIGMVCVYNRAILEKEILNLYKEPFCMFND